MTNEQLKQENRLAVLYCAINIFAKEGIDKTSYSMIARSVGVSERTVYRYFPSKDELIKGTLNLCKEKVHEHINDLSFSKSFAEATGKQQVLMLCRTILTLTRNYTICSASFVYMEEYLNRSDESGSFLLYDAGKNMTVDWFRKAFKKGARDGSINPALIDNEDNFIFLAVEFRGFLNRIAVISAHSERYALYDPVILSEKYLEKAKLILSL